MVVFCAAKEVGCEGDGIALRIRGRFEEMNLAGRYTIDRIPGDSKAVKVDTVCTASLFYPDDDEVVMPMRGMVSGAISFKPVQGMDCKGRLCDCISEL